MEMHPGVNQTLMSGGPLGSQYGDFRRVSIHAMAGTPPPEDYVGDCSPGGIIYL